MSIHNDDRQYGTDEERREWEQELKAEYRKQEYDDERWMDDARSDRQSYYAM